MTHFFLLKKLLDLFCFLVALPYIFLGRFADHFGQYSDVSLFVSKLPFWVGNRIRFWYYKFTLDKVGDKVSFKYGSFCQYTNISIGNNVLIGIYNAIGECCIGNDVLLGGFVNILSGRRQHVMSNSQLTISNSGGSRIKIIIGNDVWVGSNAVIAASICDHCVIGAGAVLVKDANVSGVYVSNPATYIKPIIHRAL